MFASTRAYSDAFADGKTKYSTWRKSPSQATVTGVWFDLGMSPGNPVPNYYASAPLVAATLNGNEGIFHGAAVTPSAKYLARFTMLATAATALSMPVMLLDYLLYYPFIDQGTNDIQALTNSTTLPRYTSGDGVQAMLVMTNPQVTGSQTVRMTYTNSSGVAGRVSTITTTNTATAIGSINTSAPTTAGTAGPFLPLQSGDTGIQLVESFEYVTGSDVGLCSLVLVKPIASSMIRGIDAPVEVELLRTRGSLPRIYDGAFLNLICLPQGSLAATAIHGDATFVWS